MANDAPNEQFPESDPSLADGTGLAPALSDDTPCRGDSEPLLDSAYMPRRRLVALGTLCLLVPTYLAVPGGHGVQGIGEAMAHAWRERESLWLLFVLLSLTPAICSLLVGALSFSLCLAGRSSRVLCLVLRCICLAFSWSVALPLLFAYVDQGTYGLAAGLLAIVGAVSAAAILALRRSRTQYAKSLTMIAAMSFAFSVFLTCMSLGKYARYSWYHIPFLGIVVGVLFLVVSLVRDYRNRISQLSGSILETKFPGIRFGRTECVMLAEEFEFPDDPPWQGIGVGEDVSPGMSALFRHMLELARLEWLGGGPYGETGPHLEPQSLPGSVLFHTAMDMLGADVFQRLWIDSVFEATIVKREDYRRFMEVVQEPAKWLDSFFLNVEEQIYAREGSEEG